MRPALTPLTVFLLLTGPTSPTQATDSAWRAPDAEAMPAQAGSSALPWMMRFHADWDTLSHIRDPQDEGQSTLFAPRRALLQQQLLDSWSTRVAGLQAVSTDVDARLDLWLLAAEIRSHQEALALAQQRHAEALPLLPSYLPLLKLIEDRRDLQQAEGRTAAEALDAAKRAIDALGRQLDADKRTRSDQERIVAFRASRQAEALRVALKDWHAHQSGYDPDFGWWVDAPFAALDKALEAHARRLRDTLADAADPESLVADPIGRAALLAGLRAEQIPYTPEALMARAEAELAWCQREMDAQARAMGLANWREAIEAVKQRHVEPGRQPALVVELADEAMDYLESNALITVPEATRRGWRMNMLSPEWQLQAPFFLGGEDVWVAYPASNMAHDRTRNTLRGNNRHFSRAVVHHELVPGHHLQHWYGERFNPHRQRNASPFWMEGWALYWELRLYERGFAKTPEDRIGMLFWRSHRAARILFSLGIHLGTMTPEQAVDLLVNRVGHERENAIAEVRRSITGDYGPLYQVAYLVGGWQFLALHREFVGSGRMSERAFHDRVLELGPMPVALLRARLLDTVPATESLTEWRFLAE